MIKNTLLRRILWLFVIGALMGWMQNLGYVAGYQAGRQATADAANAEVKTAQQ